MLNSTLLGVSSLFTIFCTVAVCIKLFSLQWPTFRLVSEGVAVFDSVQMALLVVLHCFKYIYEAGKGLS